MKDLENYIEMSPKISCWFDDKTQQTVMYADECINLVEKIALGFQEWLLEYQDKSSAIRLLELEDEKELLNYYIKNIFEK